jgi:6-pyruvoyltetrahydropterin/6-carboxytetrahydropterin synthase
MPGEPIRRGFLAPEIIAETGAQYYVGTPKKSPEVRTARLAESPGKSRVIRSSTVLSRTTARSPIIAPMPRLTRQVRFAVNSIPDGQLQSPPTNSFGGYPSLTGLGHFFALDVTVRGELAESSSYLLDVKDIDSPVRQRVVPMVESRIRSGKFGGGARVARDLFDELSGIWPAVALDAIALYLTPTLSLSVHQPEHPMVRLSQKFEFSASHRLHNADLTDEQNRATFGKCNNPHGHGHNYELEVTLRGEPDPNGLLVDVPKFERIVSDIVISRFDHKNLNVQVPEFSDVIPSVENIARVIFELLRPKLANLAAVKVWETPKTWAEYPG